MMQKLMIGMLVALLLAGCGRKEPPQIMNESEAPQIANLQHEVTGPVLALTFRLLGNPNGVGYQIDRAEMDPYCHCPGFWRRYFEQEPFARQVNDEITKTLHLKSAEREFVFRIRAVDVDGRLGEWSEPIRAHAVDLMQ